MKLERISTIYNPVRLEESKKEVSNIIIFDDNGVIFETNKGWFGESNNHQDIISFEYDESIRNKTKESFASDKVFTMTSDKPSLLGGKTYTLYIHNDIANFRLSSHVVSSLWTQEVYTNKEGIKHYKIIKWNSKESQSITTELYKLQQDIAQEYYQSDSIIKKMNKFKRLHKKLEGVKAKEAEQVQNDKALYNLIDKAIIDARTLGGFREIEILNNLKRVYTSEKTENVHVLTFESFGGSAFDYELHKKRITG